MDLPDPPEGWRLKSLIEDSGTWLAYLYSPHEWCQGAGSTPREAMLDALTRIEDEAVYPVLSGMKNKLSSFHLLDVLKIGKPAVNVDRRD